MTRTATPARRHETLTLTIGGILAALLITAGAFLAYTPHTPQGGRLRDLNGNTVTFDPGTIPSPKIQRRMRATPGNSEHRLQIPAVGLNVPLGAMNMVNDIIEPPTFTSAYQIRNLGTTPPHAATGTVFIAMHSLRDGGVGPGNYLYNTATGKAKVSPGQHVTADGTTYTITATTTLSKTRIGSDDAVWADTPDRLVLITCLELPSGAPSVDNFVVTAEK